MLSIDFQPIAIDTGSADREGCLALVDKRLVAVLSRLDPSTHANTGCAGHWYIEATFSNAVQPPKHGTFTDLEQCRAWLAARYR